MIDGSEKRDRQLAFELQNSHVVKTAVRGGDPEARPLGTYETQMVARTGKSSTLKILPKIGDCERSKVMLN